MFFKLLKTTKFYKCLKGLLKVSDLNLILTIWQGNLIRTDTVDLTGAPTESLSSGLFNSTDVYRIEMCPE